jgi:hypothetical protein
MKTHLAQTESLTVVIDGAEITVTAQQLLGLKQAETIDPDEKYLEILRELDPKWFTRPDGSVAKSNLVESEDYQTLPSQLSAQRVRTYIKMLNIAAKLNGEADWNNSYGIDAYIIVNGCGQLMSRNVKGWAKDETIKFKTEALALEALTYLNSEDKIAKFGTDKVKED